MQPGEPTALEYCPLEQDTQLLEPGVLYVPGVAQIVQDVDPVVGANWPAAHEVQELTPDSELEYLPAWQETHAVPLLYVPTLHTVHDVDPVVALYWPAAQATQAPSPVVPAYFPAAHTVHDDDPLALY